MFELFNQIENDFYFSDVYRESLLIDMNQYTKLEKFNYGLELIIYNSFAFYKLLISDEEYYNFIDLIEDQLEKYAVKNNKIKQLDQILNVIDDIFMCPKNKILKVIKKIVDLLGVYEFVLIKYSITN